MRVVTREFYLWLLLLCLVAMEAPASLDVVVNSLGMRMVFVPAGRFRMGTPPGEPHRQDEEFPHRVTLTRPFRMAATEVTQARVGEPSTCTVQAPHWPDGEHPSLGEVTSSSSRSAARRP